MINSRIAASIAAVVSAAGMLTFSSSAGAQNFLSSFDSGGNSVSLLAFTCNADANSACASGNSYILDFGVDYDTLLTQIAGLSPGGTLTFDLADGINAAGSTQSFGSLFGLSDPGSSTTYGSGIQFGVMAGNQSSAFGLLSTAAATPPLGVNSQVGGIVGSIDGYYGELGASCGGAGCIATVDDPLWGGEKKDGTDTSFFGGGFAGQASGWVFTSVNLSDPLAFYSINGLNTGVEQLGAFRVIFDDTQGWVAQFTTGAPVPLPAAAWLLLSGLGAMGVFARRKA